MLVYKGGALARAGHNHVISSHEMTGVARVPEAVSGVSFDIQVPVNTLVVDEDALRAQEGPDFPPGVPVDAKEGTRRNMIGEALLNGDRYPEIRLVSQGVQQTPDGVQAQVQVIVRDQGASVIVPLRYHLDGDELRVEGELPLKQTELGLTPFSLFGGALRVLDDIKVRFVIVARADTPQQ
ncbi:MAG: YceI family protein [Gammaproteobacteria bacterium]